MALSDLDTSRDPKKPDLRPLPDTPPESPVNDGWNRGARDWYWSEVRHELNAFTGGAPTYNDEYYPFVYSLLGLMETRAREQALAFPPNDARAWTRAGLRAASFTIDGDGTILFQGPESLPDFMLDKALAFAVRRVDRALTIWGKETDSVDRDFPDDFLVPEEPEEAEEDTGEDTPEGDSPEPDGEDEPSGGSDQEEVPQQGSLF